MHEITRKDPKVHALSVVIPMLGIDTLADPERWLTRQIRTGRIRARKIGRQWFMTDSDIAYALDVFANIPTTHQTTTGKSAPTSDDSPPPPALPAPSVTSLRRRRRTMAGTP